MLHRRHVALGRSIKYIADEKIALLHTVRKKRGPRFRVITHHASNFVLLHTESSSFVLSHTKQQ